MNRLLSSNTTAKMPFRKVTHVIFDMDGLLLDTETLYTKVTQNILDKYETGKTYTWDVKSTLMGFQREEVAKKLVDLYEIPITWEQYVIDAQNECDIIMRDCVLMPDTECIYEKIIKEIAKSFGKQYPFDVRMKVLGTTEQRTGQIIINELQLPMTQDEFKKRYAELGTKYLGGAPLLRGAEKLIRHLHNSNVPIALATSSGADMVKVKTEKHLDVFSLFHHKVMGSSDPEVKEGKPSPDIFLVAARRFPDTPKPENCLVFEDAPNGVKAARTAGMQVVMVPDEHCPVEQRQEATLVLKSLEEFNLEDFGLPQYK